MIRAIASGSGVVSQTFALERAAEHDPVGAREHVAGLAGEGVADLRLRQQDGELAADRDQIAVAEQRRARRDRCS